MRNLLRVIFFVGLCLIAASAKDRVIYRQNADGIIQARVEGEQKGTPESIEFPFTHSQSGFNIPKEVANVHQNRN